MAETKNQHDQVVQVDAAREGDRLVTLTPEDEDRFVRDCKFVVESAQLGVMRATRPPGALLARCA